MKKTKFAVLFTAMMAVLGLSSCLGDPDPYTTRTEIMKIDGFPGYYSFESAGNYVISPTNSDALTGTFNNGGFAYVTYKFDTSKITQNTSKIDAEIQYLLPIGEIYPNYGEMESNAPMNTVLSSVQFYDKTNMFINLTYYYEKTADSDDQSAELDKHHFYLIPDVTEEGEEVDNNTLTLNLVHVVDDADNNDNRKNAGTETRHFDLSNFFGINGYEPEKIIIKFKRSSNSSIGVAEDSQIEISYKSIMDQYFNNNSSM